MLGFGLCRTYDFASRFLSLATSTVLKNHTTDVSFDDFYRLLSTNQAMDRAVRSISEQLNEAKKIITGQNKGNIHSSAETFRSKEVNEPLRKPDYFHKMLTKRLFDDKLQDH
jgi:hypothetical protein